MHEKPLLLPSAKLGVLKEPNSYTWLRIAAIGVGLFVVLWGLADITTRLAGATLGERALFESFAPPVAQGSSVASGATQGAFAPTRLKVPALGVDANVEEVGVKDDGSMAAPKDYANVGWYSLGSKPGEGKGSAVFAGHVNNGRAQGGVFEHLSQLKLGDYITVSDAAGKTIVYSVKEVNQYDHDDAPLHTIFKQDGEPQLVLITCDGDWLGQARTFEKRLVIIARPAYR